MKKIVTLMAVSMVSLLLLTSCTEAKSASGPKVVNWWYYHKGLEAEILEESIERFNASQTEYEVKGFSVPDKQKYIVAMSGNDSPDLIELSNQEVITYQSNGLLENLSEIADANNFDFDIIYDDQTKIANTVTGAMYGMPYAAVVIQMFYNKDILEEIGETEPPTTMEDLYEMAVKATKLDANGNIDVLGYPLFPLASSRQEGIYAFGGRWVDEADGITITANSQGVIDSLEMNLKYRELYGIDKVQRFVATGNTNRYTPQDIFFAGKQLFRFDGPWLAKQIFDNNPDVNYGVALIPGTRENPELIGSSRYETVSLSIPIGAKEKEGAFEFAKFLVVEDAKNVCLGFGQLPTNKQLYDDADLLSSNEVFPDFMEALKAGNGVQYPRLEDSSKYTSLIEASLDYVYNASKTPEEAMNDLQKNASTLD